MIQNGHQGYYGVINSWYEKTKQTTRSNGLSPGDDKYVWLSEPQKSKSYLLEAVLKLQKLHSNDPGSEAALQFNETGSCDSHTMLSQQSLVQDVFPQLHQLNYF